VQRFNKGQVTFGFFKVHFQCFQFCDGLVFLQLSFRLGTCEIPQLMREVFPLNLLLGSLCMHLSVVALTKTPATARYIKGLLERGFRGGAKIGRLNGMQHSGDKAALSECKTDFLEIEISFLIFERA